ncbi:hypothetical protein K432DRAFT_409601 [Lepidopterella palustris CBS 459.81]|uniref:Uncharacterized protein n=1 Tax=Lepidopterella palustris CBS 459.81 TaxID=1314670 RepID=A0A8E2J9Y1_9PEZI|nr:hypothetical protein K432DRAFT_409601 [Lepidopterella palustris CBS 459.81]
MKRTAFGPNGRENADLQAELEAIVSWRKGFDGLSSLTRSMDESNQLDVDLAILDYLLYKTTDSVLQARLSELDGRRPLEEWEKPEVKVQMTNAWLGFFECHHGADALPLNMTFRAHLLQFAILYASRLNRFNNFTSLGSLARIRENNKLRGDYWGRTPHSPTLKTPFDPTHEFPLQPSTLHAKKLKLRAALCVPDPDPECWAAHYYGSPACPSLYDLLYLLMQLTASRVDAGNWYPTTRWQTLAGEWMLQAVLESYLCHGASGESLINDIFGWGSPPREEKNGDNESARMLRTLFFAQEEAGKEIPGWKKVRRQFIDDLLPEDGSSSSFVESMEAASALHDIVGFERNVLVFLGAMNKSFDKPDLVQVDERRIEGVSEEESREMLAKMGI